MIRTQTIEPALSTEDKKAKHAAAERVRRANKKAVAKQIDAAFKKTLAPVDKVAQTVADIENVGDALIRESDQSPQAVADIENLTDDMIRDEMLTEAAAKIGMDDDQAFVAEAEAKLRRWRNWARS